MTSEMKCSLTHDLLPAYIEGLTSEGSSAFIAAHLVECEKCRAAYRVMAEQNKGAKNDYGAVLSRLIKRRRRRRIIAAVTAGLIVLAALAVCFAPWPTRVCGSFEALEWRLGDPDVQTRRTVTIDGVYLNYLFKADGFAGTFEIEGHPETALEKTYWDADNEALFQMTYFDPQDGRHSDDRPARAGIFRADHGGRRRGARLGRRRRTRRQLAGRGSRAGAGGLQGAGRKMQPELAG